MSLPPPTLRKKIAESKERGLMTFWKVTISRNRESWGDGGKNLEDNAFMRLWFFHIPLFQSIIEPNRKECPLNQAIIHW